MTLKCLLFGCNWGKPVALTVGAEKLTMHTCRRKDCLSTSTKLAAESRS